MAYSREIEKLQRQFEENPRRFAAPFADALRKSDEVERALEVIRVGLELNPDYIPGSVILGRCHLDMGNDEGAEAAFSRVLDLDNENVIALKSLADIMERQGRSDEAVSFLTYLLDVDRSNDEAREQLARIRGTPTTAPTAVEPAAPPAAGDTAPSPQPFFGALPADEPPAPAPQVEEFLEPTALWEPPVGVSEAPISPWVEPTAAAAEPAELGESLLDEPASPPDVTPMAGLEPVEFRGEAAAETDTSRFEEFVLEREEEIILHSSSGAEYQVANDSEALLERAGASSEPASPAEPEPEPEPEPALPTASASSVIAEELEATRAAEPLLPAVEEEAPFEWAMHVGAEQEFVPAEPAHTGVHPPDSFDAAIEGIAPVDEEGDAGEPEDEEGEPESGAPVLMVTESMAELYAAQGHPGEALGVYRILYDRNPDNERLRLRIVELESVMAAKVMDDAAPSFAASVTGGKAVATFLGAMLGARPPQVDIPEPPPAPELAPATEASKAGDEEAVASGAPTRPAIDRLSLGAIFGEDPSPVPPAANNTPSEKPEGASGFSFDEFFGGGEAVSTGRTSSGSVRAARASDDEDDLDQFHSWLQSLKR